MKTFEPQSHRELALTHLATDLVVVGGGMAGTCAAITAARAGIRVVLIQDRPVLGGNASSEVRLWILGATSHMGNNNRWAREGGVIDEILVENTYRNPEGNPLVLDTILLEKVAEESNITLLLNTAAFEVTKRDPNTIESVRAFCSQNGTMYQVEAPLFCDASGDGIIGFMSGAAFRIGAESKDEFGEGVAPDHANQELLGHSLYFYTKDLGKPVQFVPPSFAFKDITQIPRWRSFNASEHGCQLWWIEHGGRLDTVHDTERIKWELWEVIYGVWDHVKNSGQFPEAANLTLEWVGQIPGKRESRRFEGDVMMVQQDIVEQRRHHDAVSFGGWAIDLHPVDGVFSSESGCTQWHSKGVYQIPYRSMYSRNIRNLFLAGRIISSSHVAFGSTRVMATCAHNAQAVGMAAAICRRNDWLPRDLTEADRMNGLQRELLRSGQHIPMIDYHDNSDLAGSAVVRSSSEFSLSQFLPGNESVVLDEARAMLLPVCEGALPKITMWAHSECDTSITVQLRTCSREESFTPDEVLSEMQVPVKAGKHVRDERTRSAEIGGTLVATRTSVEIDGAEFERVEMKFPDVIEVPRYVMLCVLANPDVNLALSDERVSGVLELSQRGNRAVSKGSAQDPPPDLGIDAFEFWLPQRRPGGKNWALQFDPPLQGFEPENVLEGPERPTTSVNAWVADRNDASPWIQLSWNQPCTVARIIVALDTDFDQPMESVLMGHPENVMPSCISTIRIRDEQGNVIAQRLDNHQTRCVFDINPIQTSRLQIEIECASETYPASIFRVRVFDAAN
ncbi:hypothetical protein FHS27_004670 [Rhodopirellula rubra]|uniref:FAD dependent oxidoreductase n=1 Tax=Aporhodopirellula rubra TaxID=980271 RepID=A0A7W5H6R2_9BACT|nr:FAD-dependent oxidoreductase [Aporhodopirellula rubra]MBB3208837.1 hypothetical protein [Aporhodopirellula rubra]